MTFDELINKMLDGSYDDSTIYELRKYSKTEVANALTRNTSFAKGKWQPEDGRIKSGKFYGKD